MRKLTTLLLALAVTTQLSARTWHVSKDGSNMNDGSAEKPVRTISKAAFNAIAGDTVLIREGVYRERVSPANTGFNDSQRVTYMAAEGDEVWLKGSEVVEGWRRERGAKSVWIVSVPNEIFGDYNPFDIEVYGDWLLKGRGMHLGEVYMDGERLQEHLKAGDIATTPMSWWAEVRDDVTVIRANFADAKPADAMIEINVRPTCFFPATTGINYITVKGLKISQAATQWSPPTGEQVGIIGPNWSKGWIIEDCEISYSKCVGICIGKDRASGHNFSALYGRKIDFAKSGFTREIESILEAYGLGWNKDNIGSHLIQNNKIFECQQAGIVGHLGGAFSTIRHNEIYNININTPIGGWETGGIKLHAAIDVVIDGNVIVDTERGLWLDWQAQGTHVCNNIFARNASEDLFIEVSHGPTLVYNNIMLSPKSVRMNAQGCAFFNNIIGSKIELSSSSVRYTPYHLPHSTTIKGFYNNCGGDMRFYNNIFLGIDAEANGVLGLGAYKNLSTSTKGIGSEVKSGAERMLRATFPLFLDCNLYLGEKAEPHPTEAGFTHYKDKSAKADVQRKDGKYFLTLDMDDAKLSGLSSRKINTQMLGVTYISEAHFENADASPFTFMTDIFGESRDVERPGVGPFVGDFDGERPIWE